MAEQLKKTWSHSGNAYYLRDVSTDEPMLDNGVYNVEVDEKGNLFISKKSEGFEFDFKVYGMEKDFVNRVLKTYNNTTGNLGVLLNGIQGTGKTVTAKILASELKMPIILIGKQYNGMNPFLASIHQDVIIFIDEFEKVYEGESVYNPDTNEDEKSGDSTLLSLMSGAFDTKFRKVFLLTTNELWINKNMLNRPGRIRYKKEFSDLSIDQINEIVNDCLKDPKYKEEIIDFLKPLQLITVDIVKSIVEEVNIHDESPEVCCKDFNVETKDDVYNVIRLAATPRGKDSILAENIPSSQAISFMTTSKRRWERATLQVDGMYLINTKIPDLHNNTYTVYDSNSRSDKDTFTIRLEKSAGWHSVFTV